jgi:hypothetical protein
MDKGMGWFAFGLLSGCLWVIAFCQEKVCRNCSLLSLLWFNAEHARMS